MISRSAWGIVVLGLLGLTGACSQVEQDSAEEHVGTLSSALTDCSGAPQWVSGATYAGGARVKNQNVLYECKQWPYSGWCGNPGYAPGTAAAWQDAWIRIDSCNTGSGGAGGGGSGGSGGGSTGPSSQVTGNCPGNPASCCPTGYSAVVLNDSANQYQTGTPNKCVVALGGSDTIAVQGGSSIVLGGSDTDNIQAANGNNIVVPGRGLDIVHTGTGTDTLYIFDLCELTSGEVIDLGTGTDTIVAPVSRQELLARGLTISNVENFVVQQNSCRSECVTQPDCSGHGVCAEGAAAGQVKCQCTPPFTGEHCEIRPVVTPVIPNLPTAPGATPGDETCAPGLNVGKNGSGAATGAVIPAGTPQNDPNLPNCRLTAQYCDESEHPLVPQPAFPISDSIKTSCNVDAPPPKTACAIDTEKFKGVCQSDANCNAAAGEVCVPCKGAAICTSDTEKRCGVAFGSCKGVKPEPFDAAANGGQGRGCIELRECADPQVVGSISQPNNLPARVSTPDPTPDVKQPPMGYEEEELTDAGRCHMQLNAAADYTPAPRPSQPDGGDKTWGVNFETNVEHKTVSRSLPLGIETFEVLGDASFKADAILYKKSVNIVNLQARAHATQCGADGLLSLQIGPGGFLINKKKDFATPDNVTAACTDAIELYGKAEGAVGKAKRLKIDALRLVQHFKDNGPTTSICIAAKRVLDHCGDIGFPACPTTCAPTANDTNRFIQAYNDAIAELRQVQLALANYADQARGTIQPLDLGTTGDSITVSVPVPPIPIGPFSLKILVGATGGWGLQPAVGIDYQLTPEPAVRAKASVTPNAFVNAFAQATIGIDIGIASVDVGVRGELNLFDVKAPLSAEMGMHLSHFPDLRTTNYSELFFVPRYSDWGYDGAFKASLTVSMLRGEIDLIAQARFLFHTETYKKRIAKWDGFSSKLFEIVSKVGATPSDPLTPQSTFGKDGDRFVLPKIAQVTSSDAPMTPNPAAEFGSPLGDCGPVVK